MELFGKTHNFPCCWKDFTECVLSIQLNVTTMMSPESEREVDSGEAEIVAHTEATNQGEG